MPAPISSDRLLKEALQAYLLERTGYDWTYTTPDSAAPIGFVHFYKGDRRDDKVLDNLYSFELKIQLRVEILDYNLNAIDSRVVDEIAVVKEAVRSLALNGLAIVGFKTPTVFKGIKLLNWEKQVNPEAMGDQRKPEDIKYRASGYLYCELVA